MPAKAATHDFIAAPGAVFASRKGDIAQAPSRGQVLADRIFRNLCRVSAAFMVVLVAFIVLRIAWSAVPAMRRYGFGFIAGRVWDPNTERYGILGEIWGTVYTSVLALVLGSGFGVAAAVFLSEGYLGQFTYSILRSLNLHLHPLWVRLPDQIERLLRNLIELLAAIPSVVYGLWGLFVVIPLIRPKLRMAAYGLGATRWEAILAVILPTASRGIVGGIILAFGRALGETMALAMLAGNSNQITV
jgi:phosphate transport system permease protein